MKKFSEELSHWNEYDYVIINDNLEDCYDYILKIIDCVKKGETFKDTSQNIEAMKIDAVVMRHPTPGSPLQLTNYIDSIVINAGDGTHEHPTQAILDMTSLQEKFGYLKGLKIGIIGDIAHSRVALSNIYGLKIIKY